MQAATARIAELEAEVGELKDRWMRSEAEIANVRARVAPRGGRNPAIRRAEIRHRRGGGGGEPAPRPGQPAAATDDQPEIVTKLREGLDGIERNFLSVLERNGIRNAKTRPARRSTPTGTRRWPNRRARRMHPGTVMHAWTPAWLLNGRLLRPAMVVVAKAPPTEIGAGPGGSKVDTTA